MRQTCRLQDAFQDDVFADSLSNDAYKCLNMEKMAGSSRLTGPFKFDFVSSPRQSEPSRFHEQWNVYDKQFISEGGSVLLKPNLMHFCFPPLNF